MIIINIPSNINIILILGKIIGAVILPISLFLNLKKIGHKVYASCGWGFARVAAPSIMNVIIVNAKDRPLIVLSLYAISNGHMYKIKTFQQPFIIKPMETSVIEFDWVSSHTVEDKPHIVDVSLVQNNSQIIVGTPFKFIKCKKYKYPADTNLAKKYGAIKVTTDARRFAGEIYNDNAHFAIVYKEGSDYKTALVDVGGLIHWRHTGPVDSADDISSKEKLEGFLLRRGINRDNMDFQIHDLRWWITNRISS